MQGHLLSLDQARGALNITGGNRMMERFYYQAIVLIPLAGPLV
jgi:hypothetical protein